MNHDDERTDRILKTIVGFVIVGTISITVVFCIAYKIFNL